MSATPNVFSTLNQMYLMGMGASPNPVVLYAGLSQACLQTLYIGSVFIYVANNIADWVHTYAVGRGTMTVFHIKDWVIWAMIASSTLGSIFTFLLLVLCLETAFRHREIEIEPYRGGFRLVWQKFWSWLTDMNCFRLSFFIMLCENAPMTFINFWLISSCTVPLLYTAFDIWPRILACGFTLMALGWRVFMTVYAYKHVWFMRSTALGSSLPEVKRMADGPTSSLDDVRSVLGITSRRPHQCDECWPVRYSLWVTFPKKEEPNVEANKNHIKPVSVTNHTGEGGGGGEEGDGNVLSVIFHACCCMSLCSVLYIVLMGMCCAPCCYYYTCRRNAVYHRNRCTRTCVRYTSATFYIAMLIFSVILLVILLVLNSLWFTSSHLIGRNDISPGIRYACAYLDERQRFLFMTYEPVYTSRSSARLPHNWKGYCFEIASQFKDSDPFYMRKPLQNGSIHLHIDLHLSNPKPLLSYRYYFQEFDDCYGERPGTFHVPATLVSKELAWPYWTACERQIPGYITQADLSCNDTAVDLGIMPVRREP